MPLDNRVKKVMIIGAGPIAIWHANEFDYAGVQASRVLDEECLDVILLNADPVCTTADKIFVEPLTADTVKRIILEEKPDTLLSTLGGQRGLTLSMQLAKEGFLEKCGVRLVEAGLGTAEKTVEDVHAFAGESGDPAVVRPGPITAYSAELANINHMRAERKRYSFVKMEGAGNDYIYFDCFRQEIPAPGFLMETLSHRHFGIGGDGVVLICPSDIADAEMRMFNSDGSEGLMCGNAIRCVGKYLYENGIVWRETITVATRSGIRELVLYPHNGVVESAMVKMGTPEFLPPKIPVRLPGDRVIGRAVQVAGGLWEITCLSMGNPHCVVFCDCPERVPLERIGPEFERDSLFPERINTEFVRVESPDVLRMRVWERGSGETLACGTGACAAVVAAVENGFCKKGSEVIVKLRGGNLMIRYTDDGVFLTGPARKVFEGTVEF